MKQKILSLKNKLLLVELPEGITDVHINKEVYKNKVSYRTQTSLHFIETKEDLLSDNCEIIGKLTDITASQWEELVEWIEEPQYYRDYIKAWHGDITAKKSFLYYLESQEILFSNPLGYQAVHNKEWQKAESKVWQLSQTYLFQILK